MFAAFLETPQTFEARIEAVPMDMSAAYIKAASENIPSAVIVFDHFHVIKQMTKKRTKLRRQLYNETTATRVLYGWAERALGTDVGVLQEMGRTLLWGSRKGFWRSMTID